MRVQLHCKAPPDARLKGSGERDDTGDEATTLLQGASIRTPRVSATPDGRKMLRVLRTVK